jgi:hypothetical protein
MSTCPEIELLAVEGLHCLRSLITEDDTVRILYVSNEIWNVISPPYSDDPEGERHAEFRQTLDAFLEGAEFSVAEDPYTKPSDAMIARVDPVDREIWDIRSIAPHPGIRSLGAFWRQDVFVALTWDYRENLDSTERWHVEISRCFDTWRQMFGMRCPFKGSSLDEYLTNYFAV